MKTVFNSQEVAHIWAHQTQAHGRNAGKTIFFEHDTIYSYGHHFPMARVVTAPNGETVYIVSEASYSVTTSKHQAWVRQAIPGDYLKIETLRGFHDRDIRADALTDYAMKQLETSTKAFHRARAEWTKAMHAQRVADAVADIRRIARLWEMPETPAILRDFRSVTLWLDENPVKAIEEREQARQYAKREQARQRDAQRFAAWRSGESVDFPASFAPADGSAMLTLRNDIIYTSQGATIPADDARKAWPLLQAARGREVRVDIPVGHFRIEQITTRGIVAGCHRIAWDEIDNMAGNLGL